MSRREPEMTLASGGPCHAKASKQNCCTGGASPVAVCRDAKYVRSILLDTSLYRVYVYPWPCDPQKMLENSKHSGIENRKNKRPNGVTANGHQKRAPGPPGGAGARMPNRYRNWACALSSLFKGHNFLAKVDLLMRSISFLDSYRFTVLRISQAPSHSCNVQRTTKQPNTT